MTLKVRNLIVVSGDLLSEMYFPIFFPPDSCSIFLPKRFHVLLHRTMESFVSDFPSSDRTWKRH